MKVKRLKEGLYFIATNETEKEIFKNKKLRSEMNKKLDELFNSFINANK